MAAQFTTSSFDVTYTRSPIGLNLPRVDPTSGQFPVASEPITAESSAAGIIPGDTICAVNGLDVRTMTWDGMLNHLRVMPATIRFVRCVMHPAAAAAPPVVAVTAPVAAVAPVAAAPEVPAAAAAPAAAGEVGAAGGAVEGNGVLGAAAGAGVAAVAPAAPVTGQKRSAEDEAEGAGDAKAPRADDAAAAAAPAQ